MRIHHLKTWPGPFDAVLSGQKRHEVRVNDRGYVAGDLVVLEEWDPAACGGLGLSSNRRQTFMIGHVSEGGTWGLPSNVCVFTLLPEAA